MEGNHLSPASDPENNFARKKTKDRSKRFELKPEEAELSLLQSRHIAREALRHEETDLRQSYEHRHRAPEAKKLHGDADSPERIGHVVVAAEATDQKTSTNERLQLSPDKRIDTMNRPELLGLSERVVVDGTSLRQVFETHLIGEHALRRLLDQYVRGEDIRKSLQREIVEHEIDFERDPALRDMSVASDDNTSDQSAADTAKETLNQLLKKASIGLFGGDEEEISYDNAKTSQVHAQPTHRHSEKVYPQSRRPFDRIMAGIIALLVILVIVLYFWHR